MADGVHGHHSVDPSERRTERTFGSTSPGRAKLERGGVNLDHFGEEIIASKVSSIYFNLYIS